MAEDASGQEGPTIPRTAPLYFSRTYDETLGLLHEARSCIMRHGDGPALSIRARLTFSKETMRLTTRLTSVMAWLLAQRAVHEGEIERKRAGDEHALTARELCLEDGDAEDKALLPADLQILLDRSHSLYARVARLDDQVRASA
ncbi:MAG: DUF1465 family protein [Alphaproteobacteria bacterium]